MKYIPIIPTLGILIMKQVPHEIFKMEEIIIFELVFSPLQSSKRLKSGMWSAC